MATAVSHPRAAELTRLVKAVEKAGLRVSAVEVRWDDNAPVWVIKTGGEEPQHVGEARLG
jgi:hypothetical protein